MLDNDNDTNFLHRAFLSSIKILIVNIVYYSWKCVLNTRTYRNFTEMYPDLRTNVNEFLKLKYHFIMSQIFPVNFASCVQAIFCKKLDPFAWKLGLFHRRLPYLENLFGSVLSVFWIYFYLFCACRGFEGFFELNWELTPNLILHLKWKLGEERENKIKYYKYCFPLQG